MNQKLLSIHQIWKSNQIYWVGSYKTVLGYVSKDYSHIFKPIVKGERSAKRYFVPQENVREFVRRFENNELSQ